jgi:hypothetical protein
MGLPKGCADFRAQSCGNQRLVVFELLLLVEKNPVNGQEHAERCDTQNVSSKQPENFMADLGFE